MTGRLVLSFKKTDNPYAVYENLGVWGEIMLRWNEITLLNKEWYITDVVEIFLDNRNKLLHEIYPYHDDIPMAQSRDILYKKENFFDDNEELEYYESLATYFEYHTFHLRGTDTPFFYVGKKKNKIGEISYKLGNTYFSYDFNMEDFIESVVNELLSFDIRNL